MIEPDEHVTPSLVPCETAACCNHTASQPPAVSQPFPYKWPCRPSAASSRGKMQRCCRSRRAAAEETFCADQISNLAGHGEVWAPNKLHLVQAIQAARAVEQPRSALSLMQATAGSCWWVGRGMQEGLGEAVEPQGGAMGGRAAVFRPGLDGRLRNGRLAVISL